MQLQKGFDEIKDLIVDFCSSEAGDQRDIYDACDVLYQRLPKHALCMSSQGVRNDELQVVSYCGRVNEVVRCILLVYQGQFLA